MSCVHCDQPLTANMNYDGRITGRCDTENCGDCYSTQDLCLITLPKIIEPETGQERDPYMVRINNINEAEKISNQWIDIKTTNYDGLKQEVFDSLREANPGLIKVTQSQILINQALINATNDTCHRLQRMSRRKDNWYSITALVQNSKSERETVRAVVEKFIKESRPYEVRYYIRRCGRAMFVHTAIYGFIIGKIIERTPGEDEANEDENDYN